MCGYSRIESTEALLARYDFQPLIHLVFGLLESIVHQYEMFIYSDIGIVVDCAASLFVQSGGIHVDLRLDLDVDVRLSGQLV